MPVGELMASRQAPTFEDLALPQLELLYRVARRMARNEHLAEDLVQETLLKAYKSFDRFELRDYGIKPWLLRILHNTFLNRQAREAKAPLATDQQQLEEGQAARPANDHGDAASVLDFEQMDEEVKNAIDELSDDFRSVVLLWATMELSYQEIAEIVGVPIGTVMSRLHRARRQLHDKLSDYARERRLISEPEP